MKFLFLMMLPGILRAQVVINEVYYDSPTGQGKEPFIEWIELYNNNDEAVDLTGWVISDDPDPSNPGSEGSFSFPEVTITAHGFLLLVYDQDTFSLYFGTLPTEYLIYGADASSLRMGNSGEDLHLFDAALEEVDLIWYGNGGDQDSLNSAPDVPPGHSLGRIPDGADTDIPSEDLYDLDLPTPGSTNATGVVEFSPDKEAPFVDVWPSLARERVWFNSTDGESYKVEVLSLSGRVIERLEGKGKLQWVPNLNTGVYLLSIRGKMGKRTTKSIVIFKR